MISFYSCCLEILIRGLYIRLFTFHSIFIGSCAFLSPFLFFFLLLFILLLSRETAEATKKRREMMDSGGECVAHFCARTYVIKFAIRRRNLWFWKGLFGTWNRKLLLKFISYCEVAEPGYSVAREALSEVWTEFVFGNCEWHPIGFERDANKLCVRIMKRWKKFSL